MESKDPLFLIIDNNNQLYKLLNSINLKQKFTLKRYKKISDLDKKDLLISSVIFLNSQENLPSYIVKFKEKIVFIDYENNSKSINFCLLNKFKDYISYPVSKTELYFRTMKILNENSEPEYFVGLFVLYPKSQIVKYNNIKIPITQSETLILKVLFKKKCFLSLDDISQITGLNSCCLRVSISRLNKRFEKIYGFKIIKNRYNKGYYIRD